MSKSVKFIIKAFILLTYLIILLSLLDNHYFEGDECAAWIYYYPLGRKDYILIPITGIFILLLSLYILPISKIITIMEIFIYTSIILTTLIYGNKILAFPTIDWPEKYHPLSYEKKKNIKGFQLIGTWTQLMKGLDSDGFLTDSIAFEKNNEFYNGDSIYKYTYHIDNETLFIHRPNRAVKIFKVDIIADTLKLQLIKKAFFELEIEPSVVLNSSQYNYIRIKHN